MAVTTGRTALAQVNIIVSQGSNNNYKFRYSTGYPLAPVDLTGWTAEMQIRQSKGRALWLSATTSNFISLDSEGYITISIPHTETELVEWDNYRVGVWDIELTDTYGNRVRFAEGIATISQDVTRDG